MTTPAEWSALRVDTARLLGRIDELLWGWVGDISTRDLHRHAELDGSATLAGLPGAGGAL